MKHALMLAAGLGLAACATDDVNETTARTACRADLPVGGVATFAELGEANEGIAFGPDGRLYAAGTKSGAVWAFTTDGAKEKIAVAPSALGIAFQGGDLIIAGFDTDAVYRARGGDVSVYAAPISKPNFVAVTPWSSLLVSNDYADLISEVTAGGARLWTDAVPSPNGMAFDEGGERLYVVTTFDDHPHLWRVGVAGKKAGAAVPVADFEASATPDGLALAADGSVFVALNVAGKLARVDPETGTVTEAAAGLTFPASLAFGQGDFDPCSVYVTQLFGKGIHRVAVGVAGAKLY